MAGIVFHSMAESAYLWTAMLVAREKGVPFEFQALEYRSPAHLKLHPFGKMPVMQHGDVFLYETAAIAHYIDKAFDGPALQPADALGQANTIRWIGIVNSYVFPVMNKLMKERLVKTLWNIAPDAEFLQSAPEQIAIQMKLIDETVRGGKYLTGDHYTIADSFLFPHLLFFGLTKDGHAHLRDARAAANWLAHMQARPSYAATPMAQAYEAMRNLPNAVQ
ncbi:MAG TPA: glutathione S-transferase family protein [Rhizomicrobium sp.]